MNAQRKITSNISIEGATIVRKNFAGRATEFNDEGNRNFCVLLDDDLAEQLMQDGWNVKHFHARPDDPDQHEQAFLSVKVKFDPYPPICQLISRKGKMRLDERTIDQLDWSRIENCDLIIRPYNYPALKGRPAGVSAYLKALYVTIVEDEFASKYADIPDLDLPVYAEE